MVRSLIGLASVACVLSACVLGACSSKSSSSSPEDSGTPQDGSASDASSDAVTDGPAATTTIAQARQAFLDGGSAPSITVNAVVTAVQGPTGDQVNWYVEDPAGGPYSGIVVYCDPDLTGCPCGASCTPHVAAQPIGTLVSVTGKISSYHGQLQLEPTAQTVLQTGATVPAAYTASASNLAETADSPYRGVYVKFPSTVTVDNLTPAALYDTQCNVGDAGGMPLCTGCTPPTYSGFEANGPGAGAFFVEETFFPFVPLASSPECVAEAGAAAVTNGQMFPFMAGILDVDPYAGEQALSPTRPADYGQ